jgi:uncharacterized cupredoxin-like copper-binding protein
VIFDISKGDSMFRAKERYSMKLGMAAAAASVGVLGAAAPVVTDAAPRATSAATSISVKAKEFSYTLSRRAVGHGTVTFRIKNTGHIKHDFKIAGKKSRLLRPGASTTLRVSFHRAGRYRYICTVSGHAAAGMKGTLRVR